MIVMNREWEQLGETCQWKAEGTRVGDEGWKPSKHIVQVTENVSYFAIDTNFYKDYFLNFIFFLVGYITVTLSLSPWLPNLIEKKKGRREKENVSVNKDDFFYNFSAKYFYYYGSFLLVKIFMTFISKHSVIKIYSKAFLLCAPCWVK